MRNLFLTHILLLWALKYTNDVRLDDSTFTFKSCQKETCTIIYTYRKHELYDDAAVPIFTMLYLMSARFAFYQRPSSPSHPAVINQRTVFIRTEVQTTSAASCGKL